jgi:hypothetical protein
MGAGLLTNVSDQSQQQRCPSLHIRQQPGAYTYQSRKDRHYKVKLPTARVIQAL